MNPPWITYIVIGFCLLLSFILSGMETGVFALNRLRLRQRRRAGGSSARLLLGFLEKPENFLWTILAGNTLSNFLGVALVAGQLYGWLSAKPVLFWCAFGLFAFLLYIVGDLLPKRLFQLYPNRLCLAMARPFRLVHVALSPLVSLLAWISRGMLSWTGGQAFTGRLFGSREELRMMMRESSQSLSTAEKSMIDRVLDFQNLTVRHVMQPLEKAVTVPANTTIDRMMAVCRERSLTRLVVERPEAGGKRVLGLVSLKNVLYRENLDPHKTAGDFIKSAVFLDEDMRLEEALRRMQKSGQRLALVLGRDRREAGLISLQDILRAIFGEVSL